jgi:hypothetical protein
MISAGPLPWLLEPENPSARYLTLCAGLGCPAGDQDLVMARAAIPISPPARAILDAQWPEGYWMRPGVGYSPKHKATIWQVIFLAALGAPRTEAIDRACAYILDHSRLPDGRFSAYKSARGAVICLNGNLLRAMRQLGYEDPRLEESLEVLAGTVVRDGFRCRFNAAAPLPALMRDGLPCAWGAVKALGAFASIPGARRSPKVKAAIEIGTHLLLDADLASGDYPTATRPSPLWQRFGFPLGYTSDLLETLDVLGRLGVEYAVHLEAVLEMVRSKRDSEGRWLLEHTPENMWATFGRVGHPNKWVTLRALQALAHWA